MPVADCGQDMPVLAHLGLPFGQKLLCQAQPHGLSCALRQDLQPCSQASENSTTVLAICPLLSLDPSPIKAQEHLRLAGTGM